MKSVKRTVFGLALCLAAGQAAALVDVSAFGGYAQLQMNDVNGVFAESILGPGNAGSTYTDIKGGFYVGADAGFTVMPFMKIGPRLELLQTGQGNVKTSLGTTTLDASLMLYELGLSLDTSLPLTGLSLKGGLWGGYGMATSEFKSTIAAGFQDGAGSGFVGEMGVQVRYELVAGFSLGLDLGYRLANITNMNISNVSGGFVPAGPGDPIGKPMMIKAKTASDTASFDYSGMNVGGALAFNF